MLQKIVLWNLTSLVKDKQKNSFRLHRRKPQLFKEFRSGERD